MSKVYLSGPMTGITEFNFPAFHKAAESWRDKGHEVCNPAETDNGDTSKDRSYYLRKDIAALVGCDAIAVLPDWQYSRGSRLEVTIAHELGMPLYDAETFAPLP